MLEAGIPRPACLWAMPGRANARLERWEPAESVQRETCNCGYARGRCSHFPDDAAVDAVRFSMAGERLIYIFEKDHAPVEHGVIDDTSEAREPLVSLVRAFRESYGRTTAGLAAASGGAG